MEPRAPVIVLKWSGEFCFETQDSMIWGTNFNSQWKLNRHNANQQETSQDAIREMG